MEISADLKRQALRKYFGKMNDMQQEAVFNINGPLLVLAGAGSGKTTVIVNRIVNMLKFGNAYHDSDTRMSESDEAFLKAYIEDKTVNDEKLRDILAINPIKPWNILAITFTNKAAKELKERLSNALGEKPQELMQQLFTLLVLEFYVKK